MRYPHGMANVKAAGGPAPVAAPSSDAGAAEVRPPEESSTLDKVQTGLDVFGMVPVVGELADLASAGISLARGDFVGAGLSLASMAPVVGTGAGAAKLARRAAKQLPDAPSPGRGVSQAGKRAANASSTVLHFSDFEKARNAALQWLEKRGFRADEAVLAKMSRDPNHGRPIGRVSEHDVGFRVEFDPRTGGHINVWAGKEKGPHFTFPTPRGQETVNQIVKRYGR